MRGRLVLGVATDGQPVEHVVIVEPGMFEHAVPLPRDPDGPECEVAISPQGQGGWCIDGMRFG